MSKNFVEEPFKSTSVGFHMNEDTFLKEKIVSP